ncbi:MAG: hypothetical protein ACXABK_00505 [Candidatus Heimdallarchaeaceae archaeon]|jgi:hypothetical protein
MNTRARIFLIFFLSIGIILLLIAIVQSTQQIGLYQEIATFTEDQVQNLIDTYTAGFPKPWI